MSSNMPIPQIVCTEIDDTFDVFMPVLQLHWGEVNQNHPERIWELPEGVTMVGAGPEHFGLKVQRCDRNSYSVRLLWNQTVLHWTRLTRVQLLSSALLPILESLGTDLRDLLDQPVRAERFQVRRAA